MINAHYYQRKELFVYDLIWTVFNLTLISLPIFHLAMAFNVFVVTEFRSYALTMFLNPSVAL